MAARSANNARRRWLAAALGILVSLVALEIGLRIFGAMDRHRTRAEAVGGGDHTVLCLGDSYTRCPGVSAEHAYPAQLQGLLDEARPGAFHVVNRGSNGQNTTALLDGLDETLDLYRPETVVLLTGGANEWDQGGYLAYQQGEDARSQLSEWLYELRVFKLAVLAGQSLWPGGATGARVDIPTDRRARPPDLHQPTAEESERTTSPPPPPEQDCRAGAMEALDRVQELRNTQHYADALEALEAAAAQHPDCHTFIGTRGLLLLEVGRHEEAREQLELALDKEPDNPLHYDHLARLMHVGDERALAVQTLVRGLATSDSPHNRREKSRLVTHLLAYCDEPSGELRREALAAFEQLAPEHPVVSEYQIEVQRYFGGKGVVRDWAVHDIEEILARCETRGIRLILMNYPLEHPRDWWPTYEALAREHALPFVDNLSRFRGMPDADAHFLPDGHLNERGNARLARHVMEELLLRSDDSPGRAP